MRSLIIAFVLPAACAAGTITFEKGENRVDVLIGGKPFTSFHYDTRWHKPFLHPIVAADNVTLTRSYPLRNVPDEKQDHPWHRGIWYAHGDINGIDFWTEKQRANIGRMVLIGSPRTSGATVEATMGLVPPSGESIGTVHMSYTFSQAGAVRFIDAQITIRADKNYPLRLGDTEEGTFGVRLADEFREERGALLRNADGLQGTENIWGKRSQWVDYSTRIGGSLHGVAVFDHVQNPKHPTYWHARGYGLNAANPFGEHDFHKDPKRDGSVTVQRGSSVSFRYRVVVHQGQSPSQLQRLYETYAAERMP